MGVRLSINLELREDILMYLYFLFGPYRGNPYYFLLVLVVVLRLSRVSKLIDQDDKSGDVVEN